MTNWERLSTLPVHERVTELRRAFNNSLSQYIDYDNWLNGTEACFTSYIRSLGTCMVLPMVAEIDSYRRVGVDVEATVAQNTRHATILTYKEMVGTPYVGVVYDGDMSVTFVPKDRVTNIQNAK